MEASVILRRPQKQKKVDQILLRGTDRVVEILIAPRYGTHGARRRRVTRISW
jgi:hypothetical protein